MGDIGEYWKEHKEYSRNKKAADSLGMSVSQYEKRMRKMEMEENSARKAARIAKHTIQCECGRTFMDTAAHNCHKSVTGKLGHKGTTIISSKN